MTTKTMKIDQTLHREKRYSTTPDVVDISPNIQTFATSNMESALAEDKPSPLDFDTFIPWLCLQWQVPYDVVVKRIQQEESIRHHRKLSQSSKSKSSRIKLKETGDSESKADLVISTCNLNCIPINAYYDSNGQLVEIAIVRSLCILHCKVICALSVIFPFHSHLTKLTINKGLTSTVLHKLAAFLPHSNITDICFDDNFIPQGNYFELLAESSQLKVLSLNRCQINDVICKEIVTRIDFGSPGVTLCALSLASNVITDTGAWHIGKILRKNRYLRHLNLADNKITDKGLKYLLKSLTEFPLTIKEILEKKRRYLQFMRKKIEICNHSLEKNIQQTNNAQNPSRHCSFSEKTKYLTKKKSASPKPMNITRRISVSEIPKITTENVGDFIDPFDDANTRIKDGYIYCIGNFTLCSLNLAYNHLDFCSVQSILDVLLYQSSVKQPHNGTKLMRLVLEGNCIPIYCDELMEIDTLLKQIRLPQGISFSASSSPLAKSKPGSRGSRSKNLL